MVWDLFLNFLRIGTFSIGGGYAVIPQIQACVVNRYGWLSLPEFSDIITISQMTPGPLAVNTSTFVGIRMAGLPGAAAATLGCVCTGFTLSLLLYRFFERYRSAEVIFGLLQTLKAASIGLVAAACGTILILALWGPDVTMANISLNAVNGKAAVLFLVSFVILRKWKLNPILVMVMMGGAGLFVYLP